MSATLDAVPAGATFGFGPRHEGLTRTRLMDRQSSMALDAEGYRMYIGGTCVDSALTRLLQSSPKYEGSKSSRESVGLQYPSPDIVANAGRYWGAIPRDQHSNGPFNCFARNICDPCGSWNEHHADNSGSGELGPILKTVSTLPEDCNNRDPANAKNADGEKASGPNRKDQTNACADTDSSREDDVTTPFVMMREGRTDTTTELHIEIDEVYPHYGSEYDNIMYGMSGDLNGRPSGESFVNGTYYAEVLKNDQCCIPDMPGQWKLAHIHCADIDIVPNALLRAVELHRTIHHMPIQAKGFLSSSRVPGNHIARRSAISQGPTWCRRQ